MRGMTVGCRRTRRVVAAVLCAAALAVVVAIAFAYLGPDLRKAIVFSGFGLC